MLYAPMTRATLVPGEGEWTFSLLILPLTAGVAKALACVIPETRRTLRVIAQKETERKHFKVSTDEACALAVLKRLF